jgi:Tol biopolymer transport system component
MNAPSGYSRPSFSPDGNEIAFAWDGDKHEHDDIYVKQIGAESLLQVTQNFGSNFFPAWSPDGHYIAFGHWQRGEKPGIYIVPALGGTPRKLLDLNDYLDYKPTLSWSPDGKRLTYSFRPSASEPCAVYTISIDTLETARISDPPVPSVGDYDAQFSPDGNSIAFVRDTKDVQDIYVMPSSGGKPRRATSDGRLLGGITWMPNSREILFSSNRGGGWGLWRVPVTGGTPQRAAVGGDGAQMPTVSLKGHRLAYSDQSWNENIWRIPIGPGHKGGKPEKLIYSTLQEEGPQYSPDGKHIVFQSTRTGSFEIWRADADGSHLARLTTFNGPLTGTPRWSPDSQRISFDTRLTTHPNVYTIGAEGGPTRRYPNETADDGVASWSGDGKWLYFASDRSAGWQVWKMPVDGGAAVQITKNGGFAAFESPDRAFLYYTKFESPGMFRVPVNGGDEVKILDDPPPGGWGYFGVVKDGIYFAAPEQHRAVIRFYEFNSRKITTVAYWEKEPFVGAPGMGISPDGRWILYVQLDGSRNNLMLAENFR